MNDDERRRWRENYHARERATSDLFHGALGTQHPPEAQPLFNHLFRVYNCDNDLIKDLAAQVQRLLDWAALHGQRVPPNLLRFDSEHRPEPEEVEPAAAAAQQEP